MWEIKFSIINDIYKSDSPFCKPEYLQGVYKNSSDQLRPKTMAIPEIVNCPVEQLHTKTLTLFKSDEILKNITRSFTGEVGRETTVIVVPIDIADRLSDNYNDFKGGLGPLYVKTERGVETWVGSDQNGVITNHRYMIGTNLWYKEDDNFVEALGGTDKFSKTDENGQDDSSQTKTEISKDQ